MIKAKFKQSKGLFIGFSISGHSGFANAGEDIVCASVSSATQITANNITEIFKIDCDLIVQENEISIKSDNPTDIFSSLIEGLKLHLQILSEDYPKTIKITTEV